MRKGIGRVKRIMAAIMAAGVVTSSLSGCQYESFDDYLEALGLKDPKLDNPVSTTDSIYLVPETAIEVGNAGDDVSDQATGETTIVAEIETGAEEASKEESSSDSSFDASSVKSSLAQEQKQQSPGGTLSKASDDEDERVRESIGLSPAALGIDVVDGKITGLF